MHAPQPSAVLAQLTHLTSTNNEKAPALYLVAADDAHATLTPVPIPPEVWSQSPDPSDIVWAVAVLSGVVPGLLSQVTSTSGCTGAALVVGAPHQRSAWASDCAGGAYEVTSTPLDGVTARFWAPGHVHTLLWPYPGLTAVASRLSRLPEQSPKQPAGHTRNEA